MEGIILIAAAFTVAVVVLRLAGAGRDAAPVFRPAALAAARRLLRALLGASLLIATALVAILVALHPSDVSVRLVHGVTTLGFWMQATLFGGVLALGPRPPRVSVVAGFLIAAAAALDVTSIDRFTVAFATLGVAGAVPAALVLLAAGVVATRRLLGVETGRLAA
jgi:ethanolamine utilization microcompartment shell protein EutS